jgi:hypothetical protein
MLVCFSNLIPMSKDVQLQYPQAKMKGPAAESDLGSSEGASNGLTVRGAVQMGQL